METITVHPPGDGAAASCPLTPLQQEMLFQALRAPASGVNVEQLVCTLREAVDAERLEWAWSRVVRRHEVLRARFRWEDVAEPVLEAVPAVPVRIARHDLRGRAPDEGRAALEAWLEADRAEGFDLSRAPAMRLALFAMDGGEHALVWSFHHVVLDGRSVTLVLREVFALYDGGAEAEAGLPPRRPFREHVAWLRGRDPAADQAYWTGVFRGAGAREPVRPARGAPRDPAAEPPSGERELRLTEEATAALRRFEAEQGVWLSTLAQGAWALLLGRYTGSAEAVFGVVRGGRATGIEGAAGMVGLLINTVPVRIPLPPDARVIDWLDGIGEAGERLPAHEHAALADVLRWSGLPPGAALFDTLLDYQPQPFDATLRVPGGAWEGRGFRIVRRTGLPLSLAVTGETPLRLRLGYDAGRFDAAAADRVLRHFARLLGEIAAHPDRRLGALELLDEAERREMARRWNPPPAPYPLDRCVHQLFEEQAARTPDAPAALFGGESLSYRGLDERAGRFARRLRGMGVGPEVRVGLCLEPGLEMAAAVLGVWKAGGAYVPLDPAAPAERLAFLLRDSAPAVLVTQRRLAASLPEHGAALLVAETVGTADAGSADAGNEADEGEAADGGAGPENLAYVIYTSGSTGTPKGVGVPHRAIANHLLGAVRAFGIGPADAGIAQAAYTFDKWLVEVFGPLVAGGRVRLLPAAELADPARVLSALRDTTVLYAVPAFLRQLLEAVPAGGEGALGALRSVGIGGDRAAPELMARARAALPAEAALRVVYGPTETTVVCTEWTVPADGRVEGYPIGSPLPGMRAYVCGAAGELVPPGVEGELWIGGEGVARGYLGRPGMTAERFVPDPFAGVPGARLYRTGDRVRWREVRECESAKVRKWDGDDDAGRENASTLALSHSRTFALEFLGRLDEQVKVRGFRVEPGEIEAALRQAGAVQCMVVVREDAPGDERLVAYVVGGPPVDALRAELRRTLPHYMVPGAFVVLDRLPLGQNGKVDRRALPAPDYAAAEDEYVAPRTPVEAALAELWAEVLGRERVGVRERFLEIGGHSLLATRLAARIRQSLEGGAGVAALLQNATIESLAPHLRLRAADAGPAADPALSPHRLLSMIDELSEAELDRLLAGQP